MHFTLHPSHLCYERPIARVGHKNRGTRLTRYAVSRSRTTPLNPHIFPCVEAQILHQLTQLTEALQLQFIWASYCPNPKGQTAQADRAAMVFAYPDLSKSNKSSQATFTCPVMSEVEPEFLVP